MNIYIFHRLHEGNPFFYPLELKDDREAVANAECNPGTTCVEDMNGRVVWVDPKQVHSNP